MPEFKEKPGPGKRGKARPPSAALPRQAARQMKEKAVRERKQPAEETERGSGYAEERVEQAGRWAVKELAGTAAPTRRARKPESRPKEEDHTGQEAGQDTPADAAGQRKDRPAPASPRNGKSWSSGTGRAGKLAAAPPPQGPGRPLGPRSGRKPAGRTQHPQGQDPGRLLAHHRPPAVPTGADRHPTLSP